MDKRKNANKFIIRGTTPDGKHYEEKTNSYYLAVMLKEKLVKEGYDVKVYDPDVVWDHHATVAYNGDERKKFKNFRKAHSRMMAKYHPLKSNYQDAIGERK